MEKTNKPQRVVIYLPALAACLPFASKDDTRHYLTGVHICWKDSATAFVSTDGHKLCLAQPASSEGLIEVLGEATPEHDAVTITREDVRTLLSWDVKKPAVESQRYAILEIDELSKLTFKSWDGALVLNTKAIDATYPDYNRVIPEDSKPKEAGNVGFNAAYLAELVKVCRAGFAHAKTYCVEAHIFGPSSPCKFTMHNPDGHKATVVIMPMRL